MRKLPLILGLILLTYYNRVQQNPHGKTLQFSCTDCHTTEEWSFSAATASFSHDSTGYRLEGQHVYTGCKACHTSLVFSEAKTNCMDCHTDMHNNTVGQDCAECHTQNSWIVSNTTEIHQNVGFPLLGAHNYADCASCHTSVSRLEFPPLGIDCIDCHRDDYQSTTKPNHMEAGLSTNCIECHKVEAFEWTLTGFNHDFFPLTKGHQINDCAVCHTSGFFEPVSTECISCHQQDFNAASNPSHQGSGFSTNCTECHSTEPGWTPAEFKDHDAAYFPVYSGEHRGEWKNCTDCHIQSGNYSLFSCIDCHEHNRSDMDKEHGGINGYSFNSMACFACHPSGREEESFNHNATGFPLTGAHGATECSACHTNGYAGTATACSSCHLPDYNETGNPNHSSLEISVNCEECHTTDIGWEPAMFPNHQDYYALNGAHAAIAGSCVLCHGGNYQNTPGNCFGCHTTDYNSTSDPVHTAAKFPADCETCHTETAWTPSSFQHDDFYFPIYSGKHHGEWNVCADCHTEPSNYSIFSCTNCHEHNQNETDAKHREVNDYVFNSINCLACHPNGTEDD